MLLKFSVKLSDKGGEISASRYGRVLGYFDLGIYSAPMFFKFWENEVRKWFKRKTNKTLLDTS